MRGALLLQLHLCFWHVVMMTLFLVRNSIPSIQWTATRWNIADCVQRAYDVEGMKVGTVAVGRFGFAVLKRLHVFDCELHYTDKHRLPQDVEEKYNLHYHEERKEMVSTMDIVTLDCSLLLETEYMDFEQITCPPNPVTQRGNTGMLVCLRPV